MRLIQFSSVLSCCALILLSDALALPYSSNRQQTDQHLRRRKAPYSVVPVDGGRGGESEPTPPPKTEVVTVESTRIVTQSPSPAPPPPAVTQTVLATITTSPSPASETAEAAQTSISVVDVQEPEETTIYVTTTHVPKMTPYDNGMWHTTYYKVVEDESSSVSVAFAAIETASPSSIVASSSPTVDSPSSAFETALPSSTVETTSSFSIAASSSPSVATSSPSSVIETTSSSSASSSPTDSVPPSPLAAVEIPTGAPSNGTYVFPRRSARRPGST